MLYKKHLVPHAATWRLKRDPLSANGLGRALIIAMKLTEDKFHDPRGISVDLKLVTRSDHMILNLHMGDSRLCEIIKNDAHMALHCRCKRILRERYCGGKRLCSYNER